MFDAIKIKDEIVAWIKKFFDGNDINKNCNAIVGISGGKDSSVTAALCAAALSADRVIGVLMPQGEQHDINSSHDVVKFLGIGHYIINIGDTVDTMIASIEKSKIVLNQQAKINTPARIRMTTLYAVAAAVNGRVANTCNLSEDHVGYSTKFGDSAGDFSPLAQLTVGEVKAIGHALGLPANIINKTPEDGLSGKSDEDNLGFTYNLLDKYIRENICDNIAVKNKIDALHTRNLHKLNPMPCFEYRP